MLESWSELPHFCGANNSYMQINHNGQVLPADTPIFTASNRSFRYGDGLFESIRVFDGRLPFFDYHWQRLSAGLACLGMVGPALYSPDFFINEIAKLTNGQGHWRIRLTVWRSGGGLYLPETNLPEFLIEAVPLGAKSGGDLKSPPDLDCSRFQLNTVGLRIGVWAGVALPIGLNKLGGNSKLPPNFNSKLPLNLVQTEPDKLGGNFELPPNLGHLRESSISNFKLTSALPYVLAAQYKQAHGLDDCLLLNTAGRLACASSANIFWVKNGKLFTPPLSEGCVAGTMRAVLFDIAEAMKVRVQEKKGRLADLAEAEEVFLTNAIQGIRWVKEIEGAGKQYANPLGEVLIAAVNEKIAGLDFPK
jgi:branched-chain amino acid aminotransferase